MARFLERLLKLQRGELGRGTLLFSYLCLIISSYVIGKAARDALFLDKFKTSKLPYADLTSVVLVAFVVAGYVFLARRTTLRNLLMGSLLFFSANCGVFWYLAHYHAKGLPWLYPMFYIWVGIFGVLAPAQAWTLANYVLTTREAKRIFGLVGGGAISGWIVGGLLTTLFATHYGTESLLIVIGVFLAICAGLVHLIWRDRQTTLLDPEGAEPRADESTTNIRESLQALLSSPYLLAIGAVICMSSLVTTFAGWQFKAIAKLTYEQKDALTAFFGNFNFLAGILCLVTQLLLTSRVLRRFGIGPALFVVPVALLGGEMAVLAWGGLLSAILLKGLDQVLRYSIDKSSVELLYLPIPQTIKIQAKSFLDTVIWRMGDGLAALALVLFTDQFGWSAVRVSWVNMVFIFGWFAAAFFARRQYVATLRESILRHRLDAERASAPVLDRSTTEILVSNLRAADPKEIVYALDLFDMQRQRATHPAVRDLLTHPDARVRRRALSILAAADDKTIGPQVEKLLNDPDLEVRTEALLYLTYHANIDPVARIQELGDFADYSIRSGMVAFLARPGAAQNLEAARVMLDTMVRETDSDGQRTRLEAARLLGTLPDEFDAQLRMLLADTDPDVTRAAIAAVGKLNKRRFALLVVDRLCDPQFTPDAVEALGEMGDRIIGAIRDHMGDSSVPIEIRREIPGVLIRIGTPAAAHVLEAHLLESDTALRFRIISALNKLRQAHPNIELDAQLVETVLAAEIMGHYRSYQILGTLGEDVSSDEPVIRALRETIEQEVERIFRLLGLLHPQLDLYSAYFGVQSKDVVVHDNALEFLDNVLKPQLRNMLVPLLDSDVSVPQRVTLANRIVGAQVQSQEEAVAALVSSDDPWLKSCGAYAIGSLGLRSLAKHLDECLAHPDPLLRETARQAKLRLAGMAASGN